MISKGVIQLKVSQLACREAHDRDFVEYFSGACARNAEE